MIPPPRVSVRTKYVLYVDEEPAGWRLMRGEPLPICEFQYDDEAKAQEAGAKLDAYIQGHWSKRQSKKKQVVD